MLAMPGGQRRLANVRKLMRLAREHERTEGRDLRGFLDLVEELADERLAGDREGEAPLHGEDDGAASGRRLPAVRLMTIHRAKGLEFPVVCVADLGRAAAEPGARGGAGRLAPDDARVGVKLRRSTRTASARWTTTRCWRRSGRRPTPRSAGSSTWP